MKSKIYLCEAHYEEFKSNFDKGPLGLEMRVTEPNFHADCEAANVLDKKCSRQAKYRIEVDLSKVPRISKHVERKADKETTDFVNELMGLADK